MKDDSVTMAVLRDGRCIISHPEPGSLARTTGWVTWNASMVCLRYLEDHRQAVVENKLCGDLSSGNGLIAIALTMLGATDVVATEVTACLELTKANVELNACDVRKKAEVAEFFWGNDNSPFSNADFDVIVACDLLFIAIRDGLLNELSSTLKQLVRNKKAKILFCFEERVCNKERQFMTELEKFVSVETIPDSDMDLSDCKDDASEDNEGMDLFYQPPDIRMYWLQHKPFPSSTD